jgi:hypothetical protein
MTIDGLAQRIHAALLGASAGEAAAERPVGVRQLLDLAELLAGNEARIDAQTLREHGLDTAPAGGPASLLLRAVLAGLVTPLDRPRLRQASHRLVTVARGDEGTAMTAVATGVLAADLTRFDLETALVRLRQTLLEEAPSALHVRLRPFGWTEAPAASSDPGASLQLAITALDRAESIPDVIETTMRASGDVAAACALAGALAGARHRLEGCEAAWLAAVPARQRIDTVATALGGVADALLLARGAGFPASQ